MASQFTVFAGATSVLTSQLDGNFAYLMAGTGTYAGVAVGTANALVLNLPVLPSAYVPGQAFTFYASAANTAAPTVKIGSLAAIPLTDSSGNAIPANGIQTGKIYQAFVGASGTSAVLLSPSSAYQPLQTTFIVGDASYVATAGSPVVIYYGSPITANRNAGFGQGATAGEFHRVIRGPACTGAFTITIGNDQSRVLSAPGQWCDSHYTGSAWLETAAGGF